MKKALVLFLVLCLVFSFSACGKKNNNTMEVFSETGIEIDTAAFPEKTVLNVVAIDSTNEKYSTAKTAIPEAVELFAYEITAESKGVKVQPDGTVTVNFPLPATYDSTKHDVAIYYVADDGTAELITSSVGEGKITATLTHFSTYVVVLLEKGEDKATETSSEPTSSETSSATPVSSEEPASSETPVSSTPPKTNPTPAISETTARELTEKFLNAGRWAYGGTTDEGPFYNVSDFKNIDPLTIEDFLFKYNRDDFAPYETQDGGFFKYTVSYDFMTKLSKEAFGYEYDFKKSTTDEGVLQFKYNSADNTIAILEGGGGMGSPDCFIYRGFSQSDDTCLVDVVYRTYVEQQPSGTENVDWINQSFYGEDCFFTLSKPSTITLKYVNGTLVFRSFMPK